ncbi:MAG: malectin [Candidatus Sumerlaeota bacterium]
MKRILTLLAVIALATIVFTGCGHIGGGPTTDFALRVNCGADQPYTDLNGNLWVPDQLMYGDKTWGHLDGDYAVRSPMEIAGSKCPEIYLTERHSVSKYVFTVPEGEYMVRLHFAETYEGIMAEGERVFAVSVNDEEVYPAVDPFKEGGGLFKPVIKEVEDVEPVDGKITIGFSINIQNPEINGIEVIGQ